MVQKLIQESEKMDAPIKKDRSKAPIRKQEDHKLIGTLVSVFFVLGFIAVTWITMFMTYNARL